MILLPVLVAPSGIHGNGLFVTGPVPRGAPVWRFEPGFDRAFTDAEAEAWAPEARGHLLRFAYRWIGDGRWHLSGDHGCFMNHSASPNTGAADGGVDPAFTVALRDIAAGEELTCDYRAFDLEADAKLGSAVRA